MSIEVPAQVDTDELIWNMVRYMDHDELLQFIIDLDQSVADWDFTEGLYDHFKQEHKEFKAEKKVFG